ncbi:MAG: TlpA family protein disulfide reductase [Fimbriimonas sp.]
MALRSGTPMPSLNGATGWINGAADLSAAAPTLVHFWSVSCHLCHENMPAVQDWRAKYSPHGLRVVAVHMPRDAADLDIVAAKEDAAQSGIIEPCALDHSLKIADEFQNTFVPAYYLFDEQGNLKGRAAGAHGVWLLQSALDRLFEKQASSSNPFLG